MNRRTVLKLAGLFAANAVLAGCGADAEPTTQPSGDSEKTMSTTTQPSTVTVNVFDKSGQLVEVTEPKVIKTDAEWKKLLTPDQYQVARAKGTERPFCGTLLDNHKEGVYTCVCCNLPLFASDSKFNSGTGWPSFFKPVSKNNVVEHEDDTLGMSRTEILCGRCDCHLGHVFDDGPRPTGLRFCVNSESLKFTDNSDLASLAEKS